MKGLASLTMSPSLVSIPEVDLAEAQRDQVVAERGGRVIVIDPSRTRTAEAADQHIRIRPGTDAVLLAAVAHHLTKDEVRPVVHPVCEVLAISSTHLARQ